VGARSGRRGTAVTRPTVARPGAIPLPVLVLPVAALLGAAAVHSPEFVVVGVLGAFLAVLMLTNLVLGVAFFTIITFFQQTPGGDSLALSKPVGLVLTISWAAALLQRRDDLPFLPRDRPGLSFILAAFLGWAAISVVWATDPDETKSSVVRLALVVVLFLVVHSAVRTPRDLRLLAWAFVTGTFLTTVYGLVFGLYNEGRFTGGLSDANFLAAAVVASLAMCGFMLSSERRARARIVLVIFAGLDAVALVLTQSRGGLIALAVVLAVACLLAGRLRGRAIALTLVVVAVGVGYYAVLAPATVRERATSISAEASAGRADAWRIAIEMAEDHPLIGVGLNNFPVVQSEYVAGSVNLVYGQLFRELSVAAHNTYLQILSELGVVGLALLLAVALLTMFVAIGSLRQLSAYRDPETDRLVRGLIVAAVGLLMSFAFLSGQYEKQLWLVLGVLAAIPSVVEAAAARAPEASTTRTSR
jgi:O-antigen ligase